MGTFPTPSRTASDDRLTEEDIAECSKWFYKSLLQNFERTWDPEERQQRILFSAIHSRGEKYKYFTDSEEIANIIIKRVNQKLAIDGWTITDWSIEHDLQYHEDFRGKTEINIELSEDRSAKKMLGEAIDSSSSWDCFHEFQNGTKIIISNGKILIQGKKDIHRHLRYEARDKKIENKSDDLLRFSEAKNIEPFNEGYEHYFDEDRRLVIYMEHNGKRQNTGKYNRPIHFRVDDETYTKAKIFCEKKGITISTLVRDLLDEYRTNNKLTDTHRE